MTHEINPVITGYASIFRSVDQQGDNVMPGAFSGGGIPVDIKIPVLWQHHPHQPLGVLISAKEDMHGLQVTLKIAEETQLGRDVLRLIHQGAITGLSIGFKVVQWRKGVGNVRRFLDKLILKEISIVTFPAHHNARILVDKNFGMCDG